jgi:hypothetical protein
MSQPDYPDHISAAQRVELDAVRQRIASYFESRTKNDPAIMKAGKLTSHLGQHQDGKRTQLLSGKEYSLNVGIVVSFSIGAVGTSRPTADDQPVSFSQFFAIPLLAKIYWAGIYAPGASWTAVFAVYDDGTLLWLDDHTSNHEFDLFWQREHIRWANARQAASFMMETKFHWLTEPSRYAVLDSVDDIPQSRLRAYLQEVNALAELEKYEAELVHVASDIRPPKLTSDANGTSLVFSVWLLALGRLYNINCRFDPGGHLTYHGELIGEGIGEAFAPK